MAGFGKKNGAAWRRLIDFTVNFQLPWMVLENFGELQNG
jgi:hypothetical protein